MTDPLVSVIMPAYNAEKYLSEAIWSVISQTYTRWELIIIDDGSTDGTKSIAEKYVKADARIKLFNQKNKRLGAARNTGLKNAKGKWIAFLDADDLWVAEKLQKQLAVAKEQDSAGVIFSAGYIFYDNNLKITQPYSTVTGYHSATKIYQLEYRGNYIPVLSVIVKKKHVEDIGMQDESPYLYGCEDWDYWLRLAINKVPFFGMDEKLFYYRRHTANMSNDNELMTLAKAAVFIKNFKKELLSPAEAATIKGFINRTICCFIKSGKIKEASFLNRGMHNISGIRLRKFGCFMIDNLGKSSYYLIRLVFKIDALLNSN